MTDLIFYQGHWICALRESDQHEKGEDGIIRLIYSPDGRFWCSLASFSALGVDLRDPKLSITPNGMLMLLLGGIIFDEEGALLQIKSYVTFSKDGSSWTPFIQVAPTNEWLWRVTWHKGISYGVTYSFSDPEDLKKEWLAKLYYSSWTQYKLLTQWKIPGRPSEATLRFRANDEMVALVRRNDRENEHAWLGWSRHPYTLWEWEELNIHLGGPNFLIIDGHIWVAGRAMVRTPYGCFEQTVVGRYCQGLILPGCILPSGIDSSYPGMVYKDGLLWISYYSSHEEPDKAAVYLAKVKLFPN